MSDKSPTSLTLAGDWSKPVNTLIEKCSDAVGGLFAPYQVRRLASAKADANEIEACSQIKITDLHRRAFDRWITEEAKKQENMEAIVRKAIPDVKADAEPQRMDDDWITNFFDQCRLISDDQMQTLWARILSEEANQPRRFSRRTITLVGSLEKSDVDRLSRLCSCIFDIDGPTAVVFHPDNDIYRNAGLTFKDFMLLEEAGLIQVDPASPFYRMNMPQAFRVRYFDSSFTFYKQNTAIHRLLLGCVSLTQAGIELVSLCDAKPCPSYLDFTILNFAQYGIDIRKIPPVPTP